MRWLKSVGIVFYVLLFSFLFVSAAFATGHTLSVTVYDHEGTTTVTADITVTGPSGTWSVTDFSAYPYVVPDPLDTGYYTITVESYGSEFYEEEIHVSTDMTFDVYLNIDLTGPTIVDSGMSDKVYSPTETYDFSATITDISGVSLVEFEINGVPYAYPADIAKAGDVYSITLIGLVVDTYNYEWRAEDIFANPSSVSDSFEVTLATPTATLNIAQNPVTYPNGIVATCDTTNPEATADLQRDDGSGFVSVANDGSPVVMDVGSYPYRCVSPATANYEEVIDGPVDVVVEINTADAVLTLTVNGETISPVYVSFPDQVDALGTKNIGEGTLELYRDDGSGEFLVDSNMGDVTDDFIPSDLTTHTYRLHLDSTNYQVTDVIIDVIIQDATDPVFSNENVIPPSPATYVSGQTYTFSIDVTDDFGVDPSTVFLNFGGSDYLATQSGDTYTVVIVDLAVADYDYFWKADDLSANTAQTTLNIYSVVRATPTAILDVTPNPVTYPDTVRATCDVDSTDIVTAINLYRDGVDVSGENGIFVVLGYGDGDYDYTCDIAETQNFTAVSATPVTLVMNKGVATLTLTLNGVENNIVLEYPADITAFGTMDVSEGTLELTRNGGPVGIPSGNTITDVYNDPPVDVYTYMLSLTTENYTATPISWTATVQDTTNPVFSDPTESPPSPVTYVSGQNYEFNINVTDNTGVNSVVFTFNGIDYTPIQNGDIYTVTLIDLAANVAGYTYSWYANDGYGNEETSGPHTYVINKATPTPTLTAEPFLTLAYGTQTRATCTGDSTDVGGDAQLWRDSGSGFVDVTLTENGVYITLPAGSHDYACDIPETENYTASGAAVKTFTVNKISPVLHLELDGVESDKTVEYPMETTALGWVEFGDGSAVTDLERNSVIVSNPNTGTLDVDVYTYRFFYEESENYTYGEVIRILTVSKPVPTVTLIVGPPSPIEYGTFSTVRCLSDNPEGSANLYRNGSLANNENYTNTILPAGTWEYVCDMPETTNYGAASASEIYVVNKKPTTIKLFIDGFETNQMFEVNDPVNFTVTVDIPGETVYLDTNLTGWTTKFAVTPLERLVTLTEEGLFLITGSYPGNQNYSASFKDLYIGVGPFDILPPTITIVSPLNTTYQTNVIDLNFTTDEPFDWAGYSLNGGTVVTITGDVTLTLPHTTVHTIEVFANDTNGNMGSADVVFTIDCLADFYNSTVDGVYYDGVSLIIDDEFSYIACSVINDSTLTNMTVTDSTVINKDLTNGVIDGSYVDPVVPVEKWVNFTVTDSIVMDSTVKHSYVVNFSDVDLSWIGWSVVNNTTVEMSILNHTYVFASWIYDSDLDYCNVVGSILNEIVCRDSTITDSEITNSTIVDSTVTNSTIVNSNITDMIVIDANITDGYLYEGKVIYDGEEYEGPISLDDIYGSSEEPPVKPPGPSGTIFTGSSIIPLGSASGRIKMNIESQRITLKQGESITITIDIANAGDTPIDDISLAVSGISSEWISVSPESSSMPVNGSVSFSVAIDVPEDAEEGQHDLVFVATGTVPDQNAQVSSSVTGILFVEKAGIVGPIDGGEPGILEGITGALLTVVGTPAGIVGVAVGLLIVIIIAIWLVKREIIDNFVKSVKVKTQKMRRKEKKVSEEIEKAVEEESEKEEKEIEKAEEVVEQREESIEKAEESIEKSEDVTDTGTPDSDFSFSTEYK